MGGHKRNGHELPNPKVKKRHAKPPNVSRPPLTHFNRNGSPKITYLTEVGAQDAADRNANRRGDERPWCPYQCSKCGLWHLGTSWTAPE